MNLIKLRSKSGSWLLVVLVLTSRFSRFLCSNRYQGHLFKPSDLFSILLSSTIPTNTSQHVGFCKCEIKVHGLGGSIVSNSHQLCSFSRHYLLIYNILALVERGMKSLFNSIAFSYPSARNSVLSSTPLRLLLTFHPKS